MQYLKTIVCFSNSRKMADRCIAGKEWHGGKPGAWVRPVSNRPTHEISERGRLYKDGYDPQPLDLIKIPCERYYPLSHQLENHAIDLTFRSFYTAKLFNIFKNQTLKKLLLNQ